MSMQNYTRPLAAAVKGFLENILGQAVDDRAERQTALPGQFGGLGLRLCLQLHCTEKIYDETFLVRTI